MFRSRSKLTDYHGEMTSELFKKWFQEQLLPFIEPQSAIVMDNASIHSVILDKTPCSSTKKADIVAWLSDKNIPHTSSQTRVELLELVKLNKPNKKTYEIDLIARQHGHRVVRLPPYHCHYNPIELIWSQVKGYVADKNNSFKFADVERLTREAIDSISVSSWADCVRHAEKYQEDDFRREVAMDSVMEPVIINLREEEEEIDTSDEEDEEQSSY